ncbi:MAG: ribosome biogenesis factor YjgA [Pseudomonadota bacterium]
MQQFSHYILFTLLLVNYTMPAEEEFDQYDLPSKSQLKRDMLDLQKLGLKLSSLSLSQLKKVSLDDKLEDAIKLSHTIYSNSATKRHRQYIGKLLSRLDESERDKIKAEIDAFENTALESNKHFHQLELYRDQILNKGDEAINDLLVEYPHLDRARLRQLLRNAKKENDKQQPPKSARLIFKYLREQLEG